MKTVLALLFLTSPLYAASKASQIPDFLQTDRELPDAHREFLLATVQR